MLSKLCKAMASFLCPEAKIGGGAIVEADLVRIFLGMNIPPKITKLLKKLNSWIGFVAIVYERGRKSESRATSGSS